MELKIASVQLDIVWQNSAQNLQKLTEYVSQAAETGCDLIVLPELFHAGFSMEVDVIAESKQQRIYKTLSELSSLYQIYIIAGVALRADGEKALNTALVFDSTGKEIACYVKNYSFSYAQEGDYYQSGNEVVLFKVKGVLCSVFICYDLRFPELFRRVASKVEMVFVIANWPESRQRHWEVLLQARAIENQCFIVGVNRIGQDGNSLHYLGGSMVINPMGEVLSYGKVEDQMIMTDMGMRQVAELRQNFPVLKDIKPL